MIRLNNCLEEKGCLVGGLFGGYTNASHVAGQFIRVHSRQLTRIHSRKRWF